jgi:hypothetical protein
MDTKSNAPSDHGTGTSIEICKMCGHTLTDNIHGFDQNDGYIDSIGDFVHNGTCTYCKICANPPAVAAASGEADVREMWDILHKLFLYARHANECSQATELERMVACSCGLTQQKNIAIAALTEHLRQAVAAERAHWSAIVDGLNKHEAEAVASARAEAMEQAAEHKVEVWSDGVRCSCGVKFGSGEQGYTNWQDHIRSLSPIPSARRKWELESAIASTVHCKNIVVHNAEPINHLLFDALDAYKADLHRKLAALGGDDGKD